MIILGCCSLSQAEKSLDLPVLITIGASFALGAALLQTGVASFLAQSVARPEWRNTLALACTDLRVNFGFDGGYQ